MIVSIRHNILKELFEKGTATGISRPQKDALLLWLSVIHAAKSVTDLNIAAMSTREETKNSHRLHVQALGTFSFRFVDGEVHQLNYRSHPSR